MDKLPVDWCRISTMNSDLQLNTYVHIYTLILLHYVCILRSTGLYISKYTCIYTHVHWSFLVDMLL